MRPIVDLLAGAPNAGAIAAALAPFPEIDVPEHFHVEATSALRGLLLRGDLTTDRGWQPRRNETSGSARLRSADPQR